MVRLFFSYSHWDEKLRDELEIHLIVLQRQGIIESWHDRHIAAGREFENETSNHLEESQIILLLISAYFIASKYCYEIEMRSAMEKHEFGEVRIRPVILEPSNRQNLPLWKLLVVTQDGKPVSKFPNLHDAFLEITLAIQKATEEFSNGSETQSNLQSFDKSGFMRPQIIPQIMSSNLRIRKTFTDLERNTFEREAFEYIAKFFEGSLQELRTRNPQI